MQLQTSQAQLNPRQLQLYRDPTSQHSLTRNIQTYDLQGLSQAPVVETICPFSWRRCVAQYEPLKGLRPHWQSVAPRFLLAIQEYFVAPNERERKSVTL